MNSELFAGDTTVFFLLLISNTTKFPTKLINPFVPNAPFIYPSKHQKSHVFKRHKKGAFGTNELRFGMNQ